MSSKNVNRAIRRKRGRKGEGLRRGGQSAWSSKKVCRSQNLRERVVVRESTQGRMGGESLRRLAEKIPNRMPERDVIRTGGGRGRESGVHEKARE